MVPSKLSACSKKLPKASSPTYIKYFKWRLVDKSDFGACSGCSRDGSSSRVRYPIEGKKHILRCENPSQDSSPVVLSYGIFTYTFIVDFMVNVGKYTIHWSYVSGKLTGFRLGIPFFAWDVILVAAKKKYHELNLAPWHPETIYEYLRIRMVKFRLDSTLTPNFLP